MFTLYSGIVYINIVAVTLCMCTLYSDTVYTVY